MTLFQKSVLNKHLNNLDDEKVAQAFDRFNESYNPIKIEQIKQLKEEEYQDGFLRDLFVDVFGYTIRPEGALRVCPSGKIVLDICNELRYGGDGFIRQRQLPCPILPTFYHFAVNRSPINNWPSFVA